ncbi:MAG: pilus assembly protein PilM, partial [Candidatus Zixiibacteriota bacterium]
MPEVKAQPPRLLAALRSRDHSPQDEPSSVSERLFRPRSLPSPGRHLAFSFDSRSIQMACVRHGLRSKKVVDIQKTYLEELPDDSNQRTAEIAQIIGDYLNQFGGIWTHISVALSDKETAFRTFLMPKLKRRDLDSAVSFEMKKQVPFPTEDCIYDYSLVGEIGDGTVERYKIALHAATKRRVYETLEPFRLRHIPIRAVYHTQDVIGRLLRYLPSFDSDRHMTLINIAPNHTEISFYQGTNLEFFHIASIGSSMMSTRREAVDFEAMAGTLSKEILASLDFYSGQYPDSATDRIYVYGDLAYSDELMQLLSGHTGLEFHRFPAESLTLFTDAQDRLPDDPAVCLPALAAATCNVRAANLLPEPDCLSLARRRIDRIGRTVMVLVLVLLAGTWAVMKRGTAVAQNTLNSLNEQITAFTNSEAFHTYNIIKREIERDRAYIRQAQKKPSYFTLNLKELSHLTPEPIRLFSVIYDPDSPNHNLTVQGMVTSSDIPPEIILAEYVETLKTSPFFDQVEIRRHVRNGRHRVFKSNSRCGCRGLYEDACSPVYRRHAGADRSCGRS